MTVNFLADGVGGSIVIGLDGSNITKINTFNASLILVEGCTPVPCQSSGNLPFGNHTVAAYLLPNDSNIFNAVDVHNFVYVIYLDCTYPCTEQPDQASYSYMGEPISSTSSLLVPTQIFQSNPSNFRDGIHTARILVPAILGVLTGLLCIVVSMLCFAYFRYRHQKQVLKKPDPAQTASNLKGRNINATTRDVSPASLGSSTRLSNWNRSVWKCILSAMAIAFPIHQENPKMLNWS